MNGLHRLRALRDAAAIRGDTESCLRLNGVITEFEGMLLMLRWINGSLEAAGAPRIEIVPLDNIGGGYARPC